MSNKPPATRHVEEREPVKRSLATALIIPTLLIGTLAGCGGTTEPADSAPVKKPAATEPAAGPVAEPKNYSGLPFLDGVTNGVPDGWATHEEESLTYAVPPGMTSELDGEGAGDVHRQTASYWQAAAADEFGDVPVGQEFVQVYASPGNDETPYGVPESEVSIPGGYVRVLYTVRPADPIPFDTITGNAWVTSEDGSENYFLWFDFGQPDDGIPKVKQLIGSIAFK